MPLFNFKILDWIKYLNIKNFNGVISGNHVLKNDKKGFYIVDSDASMGPGTHWVALEIRPSILN